VVVFLQSLLFFAVSVDGKNIGSGKVYTTYMWHLDQPIYWPARRDLDNSSKTPTWQRAWDSINDAPLQGGHPQTDVAGVFSKDDRVAIYQTRATDALKSILDLPNAGAQMSYPGSLIDNVNSLAAVSKYGYSPNWQTNYAQFTATAKTSGGFPRLDLVQFPYHHPLGPLHSRNMYEKQLLTQQVIYKKTWGNIPFSKGLFPAEMTFSERMIPALLNAGVEWVIVANNHISRAIQNYQFNPSGDNNEPPNKADQVNPPQNNWFVKRVDRGCAPNNAVPFSYRPHYAHYIDPDSNQEYRVDTTTKTNLTDRSNSLRNPGQYRLRDPGPWKSIPLTRRTFPANDPSGQYKFSVNPLVIADEYWVHLEGFKNSLIDYYVSAKDNKGNVASTDIFHVWVGDNSNLS